MNGAPEERMAFPSFRVQDPREREGVLPPPERDDLPESAKAGTPDDMTGALAMAKDEEVPSMDGDDEKEPVCDWPPTGFSLYFYSLCPCSLPSCALALTDY